MGFQWGPAALKASLAISLYANRVHWPGIAFLCFLLLLLIGKPDLEKRWQQSFPIEIIKFLLLSFTAITFFFPDLAIGMCSPFFQTLVSHHKKRRNSWLDQICSPVSNSGKVVPRSSYTLQMESTDDGHSLLWVSSIWSSRGTTTFQQHCPIPLCRWRGRKKIISNCEGKGKVRIRQFWFQECFPKGPFKLGD